MGWFRDKKTVGQAVNFTTTKGTFATFKNLNGMMTSIPTELNDQNAYELSTKIAEIYIPIDLVAGKVQKLMRSIHCVNKKGEEVTMPANIQKLITKPNPYYQFSDIAYNAILSIMSDGNRYLYAHTPGGNPTQDNITGLFLLEPDMVDINYKADRSKYFDAVDLSSMIQDYRYKLFPNPISPSLIRHDRYSFITGTKEFSIKGKSPLYAAQQNVNNILAAYSARYNVYVNNGSAVILAPKVSDKAIINTTDPNVREGIKDEMNERDGLVGCKHIKSISSIPLEAVNTLATIKDLEPYEECREDMYMIGGVYEIDKDLLPSKEGTTFTNKEVAETKLWNDVVIPFAEDLCDSMTAVCRLKDMRFAVKVDGEGFLQSNRKTELEADSQEIDNLLKLKEAGFEVNERMKQIALKYGKK